MPPESTPDDPVATLKRHLEEAQRAHDQEHKRAESLAREQQSLHREVIKVRAQLESESQIHAQAQDLLQNKVHTLEAAVVEHTRELQAQTERAEQAARDLEAERRALAHALANLRHAEQELAALRTAVKDARVHCDALAAEVSALQQRLIEDQTAAHRATDHADTLRKDAAACEERLVKLKRALHAETAAHAETRQKLEHQHEAIETAERG